MANGYAGKVAPITGRTLRFASEPLGGEAQAIPLRCDVTHLDELRAFLERTPARPAEVLDANLLAPLLLTRAAAPRPREGGAKSEAACLARREE